jgi:hypothetical protein
MRAAGIKIFLGALLALLVGVGFFFAIIGVFGLTTAIVSLLIFVALAAILAIIPQPGGGAQ